MSPKATLQSRAPSGNPKESAMTKQLLIAAAAFTLLAAPAHAEFGSNSDRGYGKSAEATGNFGLDRGGFVSGAACCQYYTWGKAGRGRAPTGPSGGQGSGFNSNNVGQGSGN